MPKETADYQDADLVLRVYDMRREKVMRESRDALGQFWPKSYTDLKALTVPDHPLNRPWRQVGTYWEMVYGMVRHGVVHAQFFLENNGEGFFLFAKIKPYLAQYRQEVNPRAFTNTEWAATECAAGRTIFEGIEARVRKMAEQPR